MDAFFGSLNMQNNSYRKQFIEYVSANVMSMIGFSLYVLADTFFIAKGLGSNGLAALNLALPVYNFIEGTGQMIGIGGASMFMIYHIKGNRQKCNEIFTTAVTTGLFWGFAFLLLGIFCGRKITTLIGADKYVYDMTKTYLSMMLYFAPAFILNNTISVFVKNDGEPRLAMMGMLAGSIFNSIFDYVFIFVCNMGIFGAALATICAPIMGLLVLSLHFIRKRHGFTYKVLSYNIHYVATILSRGVPTLITEVATGVVMIVFNSLILGLTGNVGVAAYGVILNVHLVVMSIFNGIAQGSQPLFSSLQAKKDSVGLKTIFNYAICAVGIFSVIVYILAFAFPNQLTAIFNSENNIMMAQLAVEGFRKYYIGTFFLGCNIVMLLYFVSIGKEQIALMMSLSRGILIILPLAIILSKLFGMDGIWITASITEFIVFIAGILYKKYSCNIDL